MSPAVDQRGKLTLLVPVSGKWIDGEQFALECHATLVGDCVGVVEKFANRFRVIVFDTIGPQRVVIATSVTKCVCGFLEKRFVIHAESDLSRIHSLNVLAVEEFDDIVFGAILRNPLPRFFVNRCRFVDDLKVPVLGNGEDFYFARNVSWIMGKFTCSREVKRIFDFLRTERVELFGNGSSSL